MIAPASHPVWTKLVTGEIKPQFAVASAGLLTFNLRQKYQKTPANLPSLIAEAREFFTRYENLFSADLNKLFR